MAYQRVEGSRRCLTVFVKRYVLTENMSACWKSTGVERSLKRNRRKWMASGFEAK